MPDPLPARSATVTTPHGRFTFVVDDDGAVLASGWTDDVADLLGAVHPTLRPDVVVEATTAPVSAVLRAVEAFGDGDAGPAALVPVRQHGGPFTTTVWERMREIAPGTTSTYGELAERAGRPTAVRAVGLACARNAATLFVPCHRVVGSGGRIAGFRWGAALNASLLAHEAAGRAATPHCRTPRAYSAP